MQTGYYEPGDTYTNLGKALLNVDPAQSVGIGEVGKVGMLLRDYTVVDITGLNDRTLARSPLTLEYLNQRGVNLLLTFPYPREALGPFADVYRKVGLAFPQIESAFTCIGFIQPLDVFVRQDPPQNVENMLTWLRKSPIFQEGVCKSITLSRWSPRQTVLPLAGWQAKDMLALNDGAPRQYQASGDDPMLISPGLSIDTAAYNNLFITLKTLTPVDCPSLTVYFKRQGDDQDSETRSVHVDFTPTGEPQTLFANLRANPNWNGTLTGLRIDPVCGQNRQGEPARLEVTQIELH